MRQSRDVRISIRVTAHERDQIRHVARRHECRVGEFIRRIVLQEVEEYLLLHATDHDSHDSHDSQSAKGKA